jgi:hypothetical protein
MVLTDPAAIVAKRACHGVWGVLRIKSSLPVEAAALSASAVIVAPFFYEILGATSGRPIVGLF